MAAVTVAAPAAIGSEYAFDLQLLVTADVNGKWTRLSDVPFARVLSVFECGGSGSPFLQE
jgi:hypothetical protein